MPLRVIILKVRSATQTLEQLLSLISDRLLKARINGNTFQ